MFQSTRTLRRALLLGAGAAALMLGACTYIPTSLYGDRVNVKLAGSNEVPPVDVPGSGSGYVAVTKEGAVTGKITTTDVAGIAAHIHMGAAGKNGPIIIPLKKEDANTWVVPEGAKLTDAQMEAYKKGDLYVNVHTARHRGGEVRAQIVP